MRTLGSVAGIIPERQQVHHSIRRSLDSHDTVEVEAAIYAAMQFAAQSKYVLDIIVNLSELEFYKNMEINALLQPFGV